MAEFKAVGRKTILASDHSHREHRAVSYTSTRKPWCRIQLHAKFRLNESFSDTQCQKHRSRITIESIIRGSFLEPERIEFIALQIAGLDVYLSARHFDR